MTYVFRGWTVEVLPSTLIVCFKRFEAFDEIGNAERGDGMKPEIR